MDGFNGPDGLEHINNHHDRKQVDSNSQGNALFDASQYAFFGNDVVEEVELGGLEDEGEDLPLPGLESEEYPLEQEEVDLLASYSGVDDLTSSFEKLNSSVVTPATAFFGDRESKESSSAADYIQEEGFHEWYDQSNGDYKRVAPPLYPHSSSSNLIEPKPLYRTLSYPDQEAPQQQHPHHHHHHHHSTESILIPKSSHTSFPPFFQGSPTNHSSASYRPGTHTIPFSSSPRNQMNPLHHGSQYSGGTLPQFPPPHSHIQNQRMNQLPYHNGILHHRPLVSPTQRFNRNQQPPLMNSFDLGNFKDQRTEPIMLRGGRHGGVGMHNGWPIFKAKYMSSDEIESILRIQLAATHSNDPYVDDYYHQACLAKKSTRHHFCPTNLRDGSSRSNTETHAFLQVDALGRVAFSSIKRPRPLLEVDPPNPSPKNEAKKSEKPLEDEPMLVARVTIEDGICLLLDVDDIDRFLQFNQLPDRGEHLNKKRQVLLEGLASSLQLVDPLSKKGKSGDISPKDDLMFLRVVSLPKGRKLLSRYLQLIFSGSDLSRVVCMAIFRNLNFLFGTLPGDIETTRNLARTVSLCATKMDLTVISACLASVVCSTDHPPLRPIGSTSGDGASVALKSLLDRATELVRDPKCETQSRVFWQASFDAFFGLVTKYCFNKYDSVLQSLAAGGDAARAISREMPVELLRATLPHTSEQQRKVLLDFTQRSMPVVPGG